MRCQSLTVRLVLVFVAALTLAAVAFAARPKQTVIYTFEGQSDGEGPSGLVADAAGNLYGTAGSGVGGGFGVVYELSPASQPGGSWTFTVLYAFQGGSDGAGPVGPLVFDSVGNLYGATELGGGNSNCLDGCGTIFELSPPSQPGGMWTENQLHVFQGGPTDGGAPVSGVVFSIQKGNLYGTTQVGGSGTCTYFGNNGCGTVFQLTPSADGSWTESVLYNFQGGTDGSQPFAGVVPDYVGNLYGTTVDGGSDETCPTTGRPGCGTIFELAVPSQPGGAWTENVYRFRSNGSSSFNRDGLNPEGGLTIHLGAIYGTTFYGGSQGFGTIFQVSLVNGKPTGTVLHNFSCGDCTHPAATMIADSAGNLYGTTGSGECEGCDGGVFVLRPPHKPGGPWIFADAYGFTGGSDGGYPLGGVVIVNDALYGTTSAGGDLLCNDDGNGCGVVYSISAP
jgi:uncharacterized repeat protein (TIGR03803 family)